MHYEGRIIRPPNEAHSILIQATVACSHNACAFCGAYATERFRIKDEETVFADVDFAARHCTRQRRVFLCGGDALALPMDRLDRLLGRIRQRLPWVTRVSSYASAKSLLGKSGEDLARLKGLGLTTVHMGLESGDGELLARMNKDADPEDMLREGRKAMDAGMKLAVTVIVGLAGIEDWERHATLTGELLTEMAPDQAAALTLMAVPGTRLWRWIQEGSFQVPNAQGMLRELRLLLEHCRMPRGMFLANHASNHMPLKLRMPRDRGAGLELLDAALAGYVPLRPERTRRL